MPTLDIEFVEYPEDWTPGLPSKFEARATLPEIGFVSGMGGTREGALSAFKLNLALYRDFVFGREREKNLESEAVHSVESVEL